MAQKSNKKKFKVTLDRKVTVWHRTTADVEADSLEEAQEQLLAFDEGDESTVVPYHVNTGYIHDTMEALSQRENCLISKSAIISQEHELLKDLDDWPVLEFEPGLNYELTKYKPDEEV